MIAAIEVKDEEVSSYGMMESANYTDIFKVSKFLEKPTAAQTTSRMAAIGKYIVTPQILDILSQISQETTDGEIKLADGFARLLAQDDVL